MIVLKMTSDYRQYLSGMTYAFLDGEGTALYNEGYATIVSEGATVIEATKAEVDALIADGGLTVGAMYKISDKGDNGMAFIAVSESKLSNEGVRFMLCPSTYAVTVDEYSNDWIGVWNATKTPTEGQLTIWNGFVWQAGETLSGDAPSENGSGWTVIPKSSYSNHEYTEMLFGVWYDFENDWICKQWDGNGNIWIRCHTWPCIRSYTRRMAYRSLFMAMDFLYQYSAWYYQSDNGHEIPRGSSLSCQREG